jgi:hypothetical protein
MNVYRGVPIILCEEPKLAIADVEEYPVEREDRWDGSIYGVVLKINVHGDVKPFRHMFAKVHVFGRDVTVYQGGRSNTLITYGLKPKGFYETPGGAT